VQNVNMSDQP